MTILHPKTGRLITVSVDCAESDGIWLDDTLYLSTEEVAWIGQHLDSVPLLELTAELER